jgi:hypothetical protein
MLGLFPVVADVVSQRYRDLRRAPYKRLVAAESRVKAEQGALVSGGKSCFSIHAPMVLFICLEGI